MTLDQTRLALRDVLERHLGDRHKDVSMSVVHEIWEHANYDGIKVEVEYRASVLFRSPSDPTQHEIIRIDGTLEELPLRLTEQCQEIARLMRAEAVTV